MKTPSIHKTVFIHPSAQLMGDVILAEHVSIWPGSVLRGDLNRIEVGPYTNIQDLSLLHVDEDAPCVVGAYVVCGHHVALHGCTVGDQSLIGIGATVLSHAVIEQNVVIGAHSLVPEGKILKSGYLYYGVPVKQIRPITDKERSQIKKGAELYARKAEEYLEGAYPRFEFK